MTEMKVSRRFFVQTAVAAGGGMMLGFNLPTAASAAGRLMGESWKEVSNGTEINAWVTIDPNGLVTIRCPHTEMGQGAFTSVAQLLAEELQCRWEDVNVVMADANRHVTRGEEYVNTSTGGSNLVRQRHPHIMKAGASARERLKEAAAQAWGVSRADVKAEQGMLTAGARSATYGEMATAAAAVTLAEEPAIKPYLDWWLAGTSVPRIDVEVKVDGSAMYPVDVRLPDMVYAAIRACPVPGGRLKSYNFDAVKDRPGVIQAIELVQTKDVLNNSDMRSAIVVVADSYYRAKTALDLMPVEWDFGPGVEISFAGMDAQARQFMTQPAPHAEEVRGDPRPILAAAGDKVIAGEYMRPYEAHVCMCPPAAVGHVTADGSIDVWTFTQNISAALLLVANQLNIEPAKIRLHGTLQGGGFGLGNQHETPRQIAEIAKQVGRPVKLLWSREEDVAQNRSRPPVWGRYEAVLGADGLPTAMLIRGIGESKNPAYADRGNVNQVYTVPNFRYERHIVQTNMPVGPHRAPGNNSNGFMIEQFVDEMALAGGIDPLDWRIKMTEGNERWQRVLLAMKEKSGFTTDLPRGVGMGVGVVESHGSTVGCVVTVEVSRRGALFIDKVEYYHNAGYTLNPLGGDEQLKSCAVYELSHMLYGGLRLEAGRFMNVNFDNYKLMRIPDMPVVETIIADSHDQWWGGFGETGCPPLPPALANAIYFATGRRIRKTPIIGEDLSWV